MHHSAWEVLGITLGLEQNLIDNIYIYISEIINLIQPEKKIVAKKCLKMA